MSGSWWAWCCELVLQLVQLGDGVLEAVVLQRRARVGGQRLEQGAVAVGEAAREAEAVREHDRADHAILAAQHAEHPVADAALAEVGGRASPGTAPISATAASELAAHVRSAVAAAASTRRHRLAGGARAEAGAQRRAAVGGEEDDLGLLGVEGLERPFEQTLERDGDLGRLGQGAVGLVEGLDLLVALALLDVGAVADERRSGSGSAAAASPAGRSIQRMPQTSAIAVPVDRDQQVQAEHLADLGARDAALGQHDRGEDLRDRQHAADQGRDEHGAPRDPAEARVDGRRPACTTTISTAASRARTARG